MKKGFFVNSVCALVGFIFIFAMIGYGSTIISARDAPAESRKSVSGTVLSSSTVRFDQTTTGPDINLIFEEANHVRLKNGLTPLKPNLKLANIANVRAQDMAKRNYYDHKNPDGQYYYNYLPQLGFDNKNFSCENLDLQFTVLASQYVNDWLSSSKGHRECMLNAKISDAGYAVAESHQVEGGQTAYIVVAIHADWE